MSLKIKLTAIIASIFIVVAIVTVGVYAATTASISIGGTVSFIARDVICVVSGNVENSASTPPNLTPLAWTLTEEPDANDMATWTGNNLAFDFSNNPIIYTITIENQSVERYIDVTLSNNLTSPSSALSASFTFENESGTYDTFSLGQTVRVPADTTRSIKISFTYVGDRNDDSSVDYSYNVLLVGENHEE